MNLNEPTPAQPEYDYSNAGRPRDFDIRLEVAEQREIVQQSLEQFAGQRWHCSEYDF
jgi:hypothetical protein